MNSYKISGEEISDRAVERLIDAAVRHECPNIAATTQCRILQCFQTMQEGKLEAFGSGLCHPCWLKYLMEEKTPNWL